MIQYAQAYAIEHQLRLAERLGFGIHGIIFSTEGDPERGDVATALKVHRSQEPYLRELSVYQRLKQIGVAKMQGFNVPQYLGLMTKCGLLR